MFVIRANIRSLVILPSPLKFSVAPGCSKSTWSPLSNIVIRVEKSIHLFLNRKKENRNVLREELIRVQILGAHKKNRQGGYIDLQR